MPWREVNGKTANTKDCYNDIKKITGRRQIDLERGKGRDKPTHLKRKEEIEELFYKRHI